MTTAEAIRQPRGAFAALTSRNYRIYLGGQSLANIGTWMQSIAQDWLVFSLTRSSTAVGVTMALQFLPILVLGLHTGVLADRLSKRRILLTTQSLNAAATSALRDPRPVMNTRRSGSSSRSKRAASMIVSCP